MIPKSAGSPIEILLVEDNPGDARLIELLLEEALDGGRLKQLFEGTS